MTPPTPTDAQLVERLEELERKATKGPWRRDPPFAGLPWTVGGNLRDFDRCCHVAHCGSSAFIGRCPPTDEMGIANAALIEHMRNSLPRLLELAREAIQSRAWLAAAQARVRGVEAKLYEAHCDLGADCGVTERDCECDFCIGYRAALAAEKAPQ